MSLYVRPQRNNRLPGELARLLGAIALGGSCFALLLSQLQLDWGPGTMLRGGPLAGLVEVWNRIALRLGTSNYILLDRYSGGGEEGFFLTLCLLVLLGAAYLLLRSRLAAGLPLFALPSLVLGLGFSLHGSSGASLALILAILLAWMQMRMEEKPLVPILLSCALLLFLLSAGQVMSPRDAMPQALAQKGQAWQSALLDRYYGKDPLGHGDLSLRQRESGEGEALWVQMSKAQSMYLKGFIGGRFDGHRWSDLGNDRYYEAEPTMAALAEEGFFAPGQLAQAAAFVEEEAAGNEIRIENRGADSRYVFVPYDLAEEGEGLDELVTKGGNEYAPGKWRRAREYAYVAMEKQVDHWTETASRFFQMALSSEAEDAVLDYLREESHYNRFIYREFTGIREKERELLGKHIGDAGDQSEGHLDYKLAISAIRGYLEENFIYSEKLGSVGTGATPLEEFFSSHKGYDIHYATAATLMFRYYGIPARYVEGYLLTPEDAEAAKDGGVSLGRERAHAWTEIYIDGLGFVPLEVTPEYYGVMKEADMSVGLSNEALMNDYQERFGGGGATRQAEEEPEPQQGGDGPWQLLLRGLLILLLLLALLVLLWRLLRRGGHCLAEVRRRRRLFRDPDPKRAVAAMYGYMEGLGRPVTAEAVALGNRAAYSRQAITEDERRQMWEAYRAMKKSRG